MFVHFRSSTGRLFRVPLKNGRVNVEKVKKWLGASVVSFLNDGVECLLEAEEGSDFSSDAFQENSTVDILYRTVVAQAEAQGSDSGSPYLDRVTARYFSRFQDLPPPSVLAKNMKDYHLGDKPTYNKFKYQMPGNEVFLNYRPDTVCGAPVALACSVFGKFRDVFKGGKVSRKSCEFVWELCEKASKFYRAEDRRLIVMQELLEDFLPLGFGFLEAQADSDIYILYKGQIVGILEGKPEAGLNGDSHVQISGYYQLLCDKARKEPSVIFLSTSFPMLTIELVGPYLRIGGAVFIDAPVIEQLTPMLSLFRMRDKEHMNQLGRACHGMREALIELANFLETAAQAPLLKRNVTCLSLPYPMQQWYSEGARFRTLQAANGNSREVNAYVADLEHWIGVDSILAGLFSKGHKQAFVKVCQGYGSDVHQAWSEKGCAPELFGEHKLPGEWSIVVMEYKQGWKDLFDVLQWVPRDVWTGICDMARKCLERAQQASLQGVHGDLRLPNILVSPDYNHVCFVDFGSGGIEGHAVYPNYMNHCQITWPDGAAEGEPMKQKHDRELLETELIKSPSLFSWRENDESD